MKKDRERTEITYVWQFDFVSSAGFMSFMFYLLMLRKKEIDYNCLNVSQQQCQHHCQKICSLSKRRNKHLAVLLSKHKA